MKSYLISALVIAFVPFMGCSNMDGEEKDTPIQNSVEDLARYITNQTQRLIAVQTIAATMRTQKEVYWKVGGITKVYLGILWARWLETQPIKNSLCITEHNGYEERL